MHQPREWYTSVEDNTLRKMKRLGFSPNEIGERLGRPEGSVRERARFLGIPFTKDAGSSGLASRSTPDFSRERVDEQRHREADKRLVRELAKAFARGDHLPAGSPKPLTLIG